MTPVETAIDELDGKLSLMSEFWTGCAPADKNRWMNRIDELLDKRLELMRQR